MRIGAFFAAFWGLFLFALGLHTTVAVHLRRGMVMRRDWNTSIDNNTASFNFDKKFSGKVYIQMNLNETQDSVPYADPKTGALEWAGQAEATAAPNYPGIQVSAPLGYQGQGLTSDDVPGEMPFGGGILNTPSE